MATALIAAASAIISSLLTILWTPKLQHFFWRHQRRAEIRLAIINEFNRLTAEFISAHIDAQRTQTTYTPGLQWHSAFSITGANIRALFSQVAFDSFKQVDQLIGPSAGHGRLGPQGQYDVHDFLVRKDSAMRVLYKELSLG
jgi:hypothetical protein